MEPAKILVVDDDPDTHKLLEMILHSAGFEVVHAGDGAQALRLLSIDLPSLVLCDVLMPGVDGYDTIVHIRGNPNTARLPVLMLSALGQEKDVRRALDLGADGYIVKPFSLRQLVAQIRAYIVAP